MTMDKNNQTPFVVLARTIMLCAVFLLTSCASEPPHADDVAAKDPLRIYVSGNKAYLSGILGRDLTSQLKNMIRKHPNVTDLVLVDVPGTDDEEAVIESARLIRSLGLNTHIARTGYVLSGGVDLFLGGVKRTIGAGAAVGVHTWIDESGKLPKNNDVSDSINATYINFYLSMGVPERFYWFSLKAAPADRVYFLSPEEMYDYKLITE